MDSHRTLSWRAPMLMAGVGLSAFTSGAMASLSLITVPTILTNTTNASLLTCWSHSLHYGVKICPPFAVAATLTHLVNAYMNRDALFSRGKSSFSVVAAVSTIAIVPFTMMFMASTNEELFRREKGARGTDAGVGVREVELVRTWGRLNLMRTLLPAVGALVGSFAL